MMKENDDGDNSQFWTWNDDNDSLRNKDGMALDVCGGDDDAGRNILNCQARVRNPKVQSPKVKTKRTWADTKITWATHPTPPHPTHPTHP